MAAGTQITSDDIRRRLEQAGDEYPKLIYLMGCLSLLNEQTDPPKTAEEAKLMIRSFLDEDEKKKKDRRQDVEKTIKLLISTLEKGMQLELEKNNFYIKTIEVLQSRDVPKFLQCLLDVHIPGYNEILHERSTVLNSAEVRIMVIGETCAGKSSLLNVLMAGNYLPMDHGQCTRVSCELKDSKYRRASIYYDKRVRLDPVDLELTIDAETAHWQRVKECILSGNDPETEEEGDEKKHVEKVVIFWPVLHMKVAPNNDDEAKYENKEEPKLKVA